jgi:hypothetical protein
MLLDDCQVWVREGRIQAKSKDLNADFKKNISFVGSDAETLVGLVRELLDIVIPVEARAKDKTVQVLYDKTMSMWTAYRAVWRLLNNDLDSTNPAARAERADAVQVEADKFLDAWVRVVGKTQGLYIHYLHAHMADWVRELGDLRPYQSQGLEHCHSIRKMIARQLTNRKQFGERSMYVQQMSVLLMKQTCKRVEGNDLDAKGDRERELQRARSKRKRVEQVKAKGEVKVVFDLPPPVERKKKKL